MSWPSHSIRPAERPDLTDHGAQRAGLADAVAAEHAGDLADHRRQRDPPERLAGAVVEIDALDAQHGSAPQIDFDDALVVLHLVERALGQDRALVQHGDLGSRPRTNSMSCSTTTTEWLWLISRRSSPVVSVSASVMPATGSSTSRSSGSWTSSMPISSHCFWPWLSSPARRRAAILEPDDPQDPVDPVALLAARGRRTASATDRARPSAPARDWSTRYGSRTRWASGTSGRCPAARCPPRRDG